MWPPRSAACPAPAAPCCTGCWPRSPQLTSTLSWECSYPLPFPGEGPDAEVRKGKAKKMMEMFLELSPDFGDIHTVVWDGPGGGRAAARPQLHRDELGLLLLGARLRHLAAVVRPEQGLRRAAAVAAGAAVAGPVARGQALDPQVAAPPDGCRHRARHLPRLQDRDDPPVADVSRSVVRVDGCGHDGAVQRRGRPEADRAVLERPVRRVPVRLRRGAVAPARPVRRRAVQADRRRAAGDGAAGDDRARAAGDGRRPRRPSRPTST